MNQHLEFQSRSTLPSNLLKNFDRSQKKPLARTSHKIARQHLKSKFYQLKNFNLTAQIDKQTPNELNSKYKVYQHGSPNYFSTIIETHKASNVRNEVQSLDSPFIDSVIKQLNNKSNKENEVTTNMRDYKLYPNLLKYHSTHKFKELLSDKQELNDFLKWFEISCKTIDKKNIPLTKKFQQKQIIISSGFNEMTQQVSKLSKNRSEILKMLWNKEATEVQRIVQNLTNKAISMEKQHLISFNKINQQYQVQIENLKTENLLLKKKLTDEQFCNRAYINTLRCNKKSLKKQQILIRRLMKTNQAVVNQNLNWLEQNAKLLSQHFISTKNNQNLQIGKFEPETLRKFEIDNQEQINLQNMFAKAKILIYRRLQIAQKRQLRPRTIKNIKKTLIKAIYRNSAEQVVSHPLSESQLYQKKNQIYSYLCERFRQNPCQKLYLADNIFDEDENNINTNQIQSAIKQLLQSKQIQNYLQKQQKQIKQIKYSQSCNISSKCNV